jgi:hypothetical protein
MIRSVVLLALTGIVLSTIRPAQAQQFSAQLVSSNVIGKVASASGRIYVADRRVRIETAEFPDSFLIVDTAVPVAYLVRPAQRIFMESKQSSRLTWLFVPLDPADPCSEWQVMAEVAGMSDTPRWRCVAQGRESVEGRSAVKFVITSPRGHSAGWIDPQLKFPIKIVSEDGVVLALKNINESPQPADIFEFPRNYKKFDPRLVIERLKHTDAWVEPPHY